LENLTTFGNSDYTIANLHLFRDVPDAQPLLAACPIIRVKSGERVADSSSRGGRLFIVLRGALEVEPVALQSGFVDGAATRVLPGECVGELSVLDEETSPQLITATLDTDLLMVEADQLWRLIEESNGVARNLLRLLSFRVRTVNAQLRRRQKVGEFYRQLSTVDGLTGLHNRAWLDENLPVCVLEAHRNNRPLSVVMIDLDHFKVFNDTHGHLAGDDALKTASKVLKNALRPTDFAARFGGEEMLVILPGSTQDAGTLVARRLCEHMRQAAVFADMRQPLPHITASFGVAALQSGQDVPALLAAADSALYRAKEAGRDCVAEAN
jgi:diguanylate cyclase (GGDEF)-like protein